MSLRDDLDALVAALVTPRVLYFPVRHHSPACAWAIRCWIRKHQPRAVLVEGPDDFQPLLPHLLHEKCVPPVAIYSHFRLGQKPSVRTMNVTRHTSPWRNSRLNGSP